MKLISREIFKDMINFGILKTDKHSRNFSITSRNKSSKRKKYYISEDAYDRYIRSKYN